MHGFYCQDHLIINVKVFLYLLFIIICCSLLNIIVLRESFLVFL